MTTENEKFNRTEVSENSQQRRAPWNSKFGQDENLKQRKWSRSSRNNSGQPASGTAKVLLAVLVLTVLTPFILYWVVKMNTPNTPQTPKTTEQINVSRNTETTTTTAVTTTANGNLVSNNGESVSSVDINNAEMTTMSEAAVTQPPVVVTEPPAPVGRTHTVAAGETWYGIARTYGVDVNALAAANGTTTDAALYPGNVLIIP